MIDSARIKKYDYIFIGTSMICVLEAVYQTMCGKSVLMIDQQSEMGGAWISLEIFDLHDVENAIHYFLPDEYAFDFMKDTLTWDVIPSPKKYRVFPMPMGRYWKVPYDHKVGRLTGRIRESLLCGKKREFIHDFLKIIKEVIFEPRQPSYYVRGGTPEMLKKVLALLSESKVELQYSTQINQIHIDNETETVEVSAGEKKFLSRTIFFTHGSRIFNLTDLSGSFPIHEKSHLRPALHLLIHDESPSSMHECIFSVDPIIKYAHDVTLMTREATAIIGMKKVIVLALHPDVRQGKEVYQLIFEKLKKVGMIGKNSILEDQYWQDVYLPRLDDADLQRLKNNFGPQVEILKTEDFAKGVGYHARRWATKLGSPGRAD